MSNCDSGPIVYPGMVVFKVETLAIVIAGIVYGMSVVLFFNCFRIVLSNKNGKRAFLLTYITIMISLGTGAMIQQIVFMMENTLAKVSTSAILTNYDVATLRGIPVTIPLITWGVDGLLIWRCGVLFQGASLRARAGLYTIFSFIIVLSLLGDIGLYFSPIIMKHIRLVPDLAVASIAISTLICNGVLSGLIASRMFLHRRSLLRLSGTSTQHSRESTYRHVVAICIESSFLIVAVSTAFIVVDFSVFTAYISIPFCLLPHTCVISPLLIVLRVAQGRAFSNQPAVIHEVSDIRFSSVASA